MRPPRFLASQLARPNGLFGRFVMGRFLNRAAADLYVTLRRQATNQAFRRQQAAEDAAMAYLGEMAVTITGIWRYPVKTMAGETLQRTGIGPLGIDGDRGRPTVYTRMGR